MERYNLVVLGAGSGGLVVAAGGASLGARVALVEKHPIDYPGPSGSVRAMGGDCLHTGCVPSKALLRAAKAAHEARETSRFGLAGPGDPGPQDLGAVMDWVRSRQTAIAPHDSIARFRELGVEVFEGEGRLESAHEVTVNGTTLRGRHVVIATGSRPRVPKIPGLAEGGFLTNETVFGLRKLPASLVVIGGGPIGVELGQAFARLGSKVTIVSKTPHLCLKEDADAAVVLEKKLLEEGLSLFEEAAPVRVEAGGGVKRVTVRRKDGVETTVAADEILVAAGRRPNVEGLNLDGVGVAHSATGIRTDARCRTNVSSVWAIGDVAGAHLFTHWASHQAGVVLKNTLFPVALARCDAGNVPRVTYTDPEIAHVGLTERAARESGIPFTAFRAGFDRNDRSVCEGDSGELFSKILVGSQGRILGATIVHPRAGDLLAEIVLAKKQDLPVSALGSVIRAYPTLSEIHGAVAREVLKTALTPGRKNLLASLAAFLRR
ncbi:MAG TPA: FAD-dependent oxidoreductase [Thermoanaerobaculia bacterium]|nr:FAD-dependent oxidoreductase [Thermoanaerobaculia bacterium]